MKKILLIICILLCTGCSDYVEINDLVILSGMVIDYKDDMYDITSQLIINDDVSRVKVFNTKAKTIEEALSEISKLSNKEVFLSHLKILIVTKDVIINDIDYYDYFLRDAKSKMNFFIYVVEDDVAKELLDIYKNSDGSSLYIEKMMDFNNKVFSSSTPLTFIELVYNKFEPGLDPIYPSLTIKENNDTKSLYLENLVFYNKDNKVILNDNEAIHYNILTNNVVKTNIDIKCDKGLFSLTLDDVETKYKWNKNIFNIQTSIKSKVNSYECSYDLNDTKTIDKLTNEAKIYIAKELNNIVNVSKINNYDFLGIGNYIYKYDTNHYKKNKNILSNLNYKIKLELSINSTGEIRR